MHIGINPVVGVKPFIDDGHEIINCGGDVIKLLRLQNGHVVAPDWHIGDWLD